MEEDLFEGPARALPPSAPTARRAAAYTSRPEGPLAAPVRHRAGYAPFVGFLASRGIDPRTTARDPVALVGQLRRHYHEMMERPGLAEAAAVFLGNALTALRADACWVGDVVRGPRQRITPLTLLTRLGDATPEQVEQLSELVHTWGAAVYAEPLEFPEPVSRTLPHPYARPAGAEPGDAGSLEQIALALLTHLQANYRVAVRNGAPPSLPTGDYLEGGGWAVTVEPGSPDAAPLTFVVSPVRGVAVRAGALTGFRFPAMPRDVFEEHHRLRNPAGEVIWPTDADLRDLEQTVLAVAEGRFAERFPGPEPDWFEHVLAYEDGAGSTRKRGGGLHTADGAKILDAARTRVAGLEHGWQPWPLAG